MRNVLPHDTDRQPISTPVESHNRPYDAEKLVTEPAKRLTKQKMSKDRKAADARLMERAKQDLDRWNAPVAVDNMRGMGLRLLEVYLIVEEANQARELILRSFPKPGLMARARYVVSTKTPPKEQPPVVQLLRKLVGADVVDDDETAEVAADTEA